MPDSHSVVAVCGVDASHSVVVWMVWMPDKPHCSASQWPVIVGSGSIVFMACDLSPGGAVSVEFYRSQPVHGGYSQHVSVAGCR